jgi:hypothetical protein
MTQPAERRPRVVLRYEDRWDDLLAGLAADRAAGLAPSAVRDALVAWLDPGSLVEIGSLVRRSSSSYRGGDTVDAAAGTAEAPSDGLIAGWGSVGGAPVFVVADDPALAGPVRGPAAAAKAARIRAHALEQSRPLVQVLAAGRGDEHGSFVRSGHGVDLDLERDSAARLLKIVVVTGPIGDQAADEAASAHLVVLAGPEASVHGRAGAEALRLGFADAVAADLDAALAWAGAALRRLPPNRFDPPSPDPVDTVDTSDPGDTVDTSDTGETAGPGVDGFLDGDWSVELAAGRHEGLRAVLGRLGGRPVGVLSIAAGAGLDGPSARTALRLVRLCEALSMPLVAAHHGIVVAGPAAGPNGSVATTDPSPTPHAPAGVNEDATVDAVLDLCDALAATSAPVLELVGSGPAVAEALGVHPVWTVTGHADRAGRERVVDALDLLRIDRIRPDQDPRVRTRPRKGLLPQ